MRHKSGRVRHKLAVCMVPDRAQLIIIYLSPEPSVSVMIRTYLQVQTRLMTFWTVPDYSLERSEESDRVLDTATAFVQSNAQFVELV